jgi:glycosyltransferase involved in cell wall biosynthesis
MEKVTAIIPCFNEEIHMKGVLESVKWADEVMVVDSFSTDKSLEIAKEYTSFIIQREYEKSASQKNWAIPQATHDWILLVDADERVTPALKAEIQAILKNPESDAYWIYRQNFFMGEEVKYSGIQNDKVIRLFKKTCRYEPLNVHAEIMTKDLKVDFLKEKLTHDTFKGMEAYLKKLHRYANWAARDYMKKTPKVTLFHLLVKPGFRFFKHYILKGGIRDGRIGFIISSLTAWSVFLRYWKMMDIRLKEKSIKL